MIECGIGARGAKIIGEMLEKNTSLKILNLRCEIPFNIHSPSISFWSDLLFVAVINQQSVNVQ
jgi:hypothetical protein